MDVSRNFNNISADEYLRGTADFRSRFEDVFLAIESLPTLPSILWEVQASLANKRNGASDIAYVIEQDPSLTANILRQANSAYSGSNTRIISIGDAIARIGLRTIERLATVTLIIDNFSSETKAMDYAAFWSHSLQVGELASIIVDENAECSLLLSTEAFMCGLLHDVGKLILDQYFPNDLERVRDCMASKQCSELDAESEILGMGHADIGARLMEQWNLEENLIACIRHHHNPNEAEPGLQMDAEIICFANRLVHSFEAETLTEDDLCHASLSVDSIQLDSLASVLEATRERALNLLA